MKQFKLLMGVLILSMTGWVTSGVYGQTYISVGLNQPPELLANAGTDGLICPGDSVAIGGTSTGGATPFNYQWTPASGLSNATVSMPMASPSATTVYSLTLTDANNCTSSDDVTVVMDTCVRITDPVNGVSLNVYPNPTRGNVRVEFAAPQPLQAGSIVITTVDGKMVFAQQLDKQSANGGWDLDLSNYGKGIYLVTLTAGDREFSSRLLVQ